MPVQIACTSCRFPAPAFSLLLLLCVSQVSGCKKSEAADYREKSRDFLADAKSLSKVIELGASYNEIEARLTALKEKQSKLPAPPAGMEDCFKGTQDVVGLFAAIQAHHKLAIEAQARKLDSGQLSGENVEIMKEYNAEQASKIAALEERFK